MIMINIRSFITFNFNFNLVIRKKTTFPIQLKDFYIVIATLIIMTNCVTFNILYNILYVIYIFEYLKQINPNFI